MLPAPDVAAIRRYCEQRTSPEAQNEVRIEADVADRAVTVVECRAPWHEDYGPEWTRRGVARLRYTATREAWTLYWVDREDRWHRYDQLAPSADVLALLEELDRDPTGIFWG